MRSTGRFLPAAALVVAALALDGPDARAQRAADSARADAAHAARVHVGRVDRWVAAAVAIGATAPFDERLGAWAGAHHWRLADRVAGAVDPFGRAGVLVPALVGATVVPRLLGARELSASALRIGLGYAAADGVESVLKPLVGRHRPDGGSAWRFRPGSGADAWHSFPSAHTVHAVSIAAALAMESRSRWPPAIAAALASLVGTERVYRQAHWASDAGASSLLAIAVSRTAVGWLRRRGVPGVLPPTDTTIAGGAR